MSDEHQEVRKLVAIMFTDMVGYSALTQKNELLAIELLEEHRSILRELIPLRRPCPRFKRWERKDQK
jgi:class 3 adenylate cyclase